MHRQTALRISPARPVRSGAFVLALAVALGCADCGLIGDRGGSWRGGIGAVLRHREREGRLYVRSVPESGAADTAGLNEGDEIVSIDGHSVAGMRTAEVTDRLRGEVGTRVVLRVLRDGSEREITVERAPYRSRSR